MKNFEHRATILGRDPITRCIVASINDVDFQSHIQKDGTDGTDPAEVKEVLMELAWI